MRKALQEIANQYYEKCNVDELSLSVILEHYESIGRQAAVTLTPERVEKLYQVAIAKQNEIESKPGSICPITPEYQKFILTACYEFCQLPKDVQDAIQIEVRRRRIRQ